MIILDFGSGNTCQNNPHIVTDMIDGLDILSPEFKKRIVIKWQLFKEAGKNVPLDRVHFSGALLYAKGKGYKTTASVFDKESLLKLLAVTNFDIPFVKIANNKDLHYLGDLVPRGIHVIQSVSTTGEVNECRNHEYLPDWKEALCCVSKYPARMEEYEKPFIYDFTSPLRRGISDHTTNWDLYKKYRPKIYECHYKLEDSTGLDAGPFARTPEQLLEIDKYIQEN